MKPISRLAYLLPLLLCGTLATAQTKKVTTQAVAPPSNPEPILIAGEPPSDYTLLVDSLLTHLDKGRIPTGILYDRVLSLATLHGFSPTALSSATHFFQSYHELKSAAYVLGSFPYGRAGLRPLAVSAASGATQQGGQLPIGLLDYQFALLDTLAEERGTIREINGLYYDGSGSPYQTKAVSIVAPMADTVNQNVQLTLPSTFLLRNVGRTLSSLQVQADNFSVFLPVGGSSNVSFSSPGSKTLLFSLYFSDGSSTQARAQVYVKPALASREIIVPISPNIVSQPWTDYNGIRAYGEGEAASYLYHPLSHVDGRLRNPVIVLDGFDPLDKRKIPRIASDFAPLAPALQAPGRERDVVILNFPKSRRPITNPRQTVYGDVDGGADYIERNALVLVELLSRLKPMMADPTQKITIIGPSMGGMISRYALALMEKNYANPANSATYNNPYWKHNVDTWISFDAPHQGANIPLGDQYFLKYFMDMSETAETSAGRLNSIAARQMLVSHNLPGTEQNYHVPFMRNMNTNGLPGSYGYPTQVRRVSLANGALNGALNADLGAPGQTALQLDVVRNGGNKKRQFFYRATSPGTQIAANIYFAAGANQATTVFNGEARVLVALAKPISKRLKATAASGSQGCYDLAPGGTYDAQDQIYRGTITGPPLPGYTFLFSNVRPRHTFIPTASALAFQYKNVANYTGASQLPNPFTDLRGRPLICTAETPFDAYYASDRFNSGHVTLEDAAAQGFLVRELYNITQPAEYSLSNPKLMCANATTTIRLVDCGSRLSQATAYDWTLSGPGVFTATNSATFSDGGPAVSIQNVGGAGDIDLSVVARRPGGAPSPAATYTLTASSTSDVIGLAVNLSGQPKIYRNMAYPVVASGTPGPYTWTIRELYPNGTFSAPYTTTTPQNEYLLGFGLHTMEISVTARGLCSGQMLTPYTLKLTPEPDQQTAPTFEYSVYPNPSTGYFEVTAQDLRTSGPATTAPDYEVALYNGRGKSVKEGRTAKGRLRIDTTDLQNGLYSLTVKKGKEIIRRNLMIQH